MNKRLFKEALMELAEEEIAEFDALPLIEHEPSENYINAINSIKQNCEETPKFTVKKIAVIVIAAILVLISVTACVYKDEIIEFTDKIYEKFFEEKDDHVEIIPQTPKLNKIEEFYEPTWLPEGFTELEPIKTDSRISFEWTSNNAGVIFDQYLMEEGLLTIDCEDFESTTRRVGSYDIYYGYKKPLQSHIVFWKTENYLFILNCGGEITYDEVVKIIENIKIKT